MNMQSCKKTYVSYLGGAAGDLVTASLNGIDVALTNFGGVQNEDFSIKPYEPFDSLSNLVQCSNRLRQQYISTHEFAILIEHNVPVINLIVNNDRIMETMILRQMYLQNLTILVDAASDWFRIVRSLCSNGKHRYAADYWLQRASKLWRKKMRQRQTQKTDMCCSLVMDTLFCVNFPNHCAKTQPDLDTKVFRSNHQRWLLKNYKERWTRASTIESMAQKLASMDWSQRSGLIKFR